MQGATEPKRDGGKDGQEVQENDTVSQFCREREHMLLSYGVILLRTWCGVGDGGVIVHAYMCACGRVGVRVWGGVRVYVHLCKLKMKGEGSSYLLSRNNALSADSWLQPHSSLDKLHITILPNITQR